MKDEGETLSEKTYFRVWLGLLLLTGVSISVAGRSLDQWGIGVALIIAGLKSGLVLSYFMHLKYEKQFRLLKWMVPMVLVLIILFIGLTFLDVVFR